MIRPENRNTIILDGDSLKAARARFLEAAQRSGAGLDLFPSRRAIDAPDTSCDIAHLGAPGAETLFVLIANSHAEAGFAASGLLSHLLEQRLQKVLGREHAMMIIHAVNPNGAVWPGPFTESAALPVNGDAPSADWTRSLITAAEENYQSFLRREQNNPSDPAKMRGIGHAALSPWNHRFLKRLARSAFEKRTRIQLLEIALTPGTRSPCFRPVATTTTPQRRMVGPTSFATSLAQTTPFPETPFPETAIPPSGPVAAFDDEAKFGCFEAAVLESGCESDTLFPAFETAVVAAMSGTASASSSAKPSHALPTNPRAWLY